MPNPRLKKQSLLVPGEMAVETLKMLKEKANSRNDEEKKEPARRGVSRADRGTHQEGAKERDANPKQRKREYGGVKRKCRVILRREKPRTLYKRVQGPSSGTWKK